MKTKNNTKTKAEEKFLQDISLAMVTYQRHLLSESIKRGLRAKKLSTAQNCYVNKSKV